MPLAVRDGVAEAPAAPRDRATLPLLFLICGLAAALRFTGLAWGAPYFHFHIDEHFVFSGADMLRRSLHEAAMSSKFFMYGPLPMWMLDALVTVHDWFFRPLDLSVKADEITYMVMGRAISAALGTACVPLAYLIARRIAGRAAGLLAALLLACAVVHLRESHFFSVDISMLFFALVTWLFAERMVDTGRVGDYVFAGAGLGASIACKYSAAFLVAVLLVAHLAAPGRPRRDLRSWAAWIGRGLTPLLVAAIVFAIVDPMAWKYAAKFREDISYWVVGPNSGTWRPIFIAQFTDVQPQLYWFTNLLWWGLGPAFEVWGLLGVGWLILRRDRRSLVAASFPVAYYVAAAQGAAPVARYSVPLAAGLAVAAGVLSADAIRRPRLRLPALIITTIVCGTTALYAAAYMHVFRAPDARLAASRWLIDHVPEGSRILVEPSHNIPPMGSYLHKVNFYGDYVLWRGAERRDYYQLSSLDTYQYLYDRRTSDEERRRYIQARLAAADWIVMDDTFVQFYQHLPASQYGVLQDYYRDLLAGRLGFRLVKSFKVYPSLFGTTIHDDDAELTFRLFDHPRVFVFAREGVPVRGDLGGGSS
jgi:4-amino-4-deoxy-L-arabinose transferase-like glycosyltransferase